MGSKSHVDGIALMMVEASSKRSIEDKEPTITFTEKMHTSVQG